MLSPLWIYGTDFRAPLTLSSILPFYVAIKEVAQIVKIKLIVVIIIMITIPKHACYDPQLALHSTPPTSPIYLLYPPFSNQKLNLHRFPILHFHIPIPTIRRNPMPHIQWSTPQHCRRWGSRFPCFFIIASVYGCRGRRGHCCAGE